KSGDILVKIDPRYFRPTEVDCLIGDPSKAKEKLGWEAKIGLEELVVEMVDAARACAEPTGQRT
ncbi:GDP-mannose 4,6-dehydratase, partial [Alphaproteobacteria bacterium]|nr:GDP-mannose 4,6-dehydratase [Alphaproteobacteria bacterium]